MRRVPGPLLALLLLVLGLAAFAAPPIPPSPTEWVTDTAGFLSQPTRQTLNARLEAYERASGHQVLVWVGKTTGEMPTEEWTVRAFGAWRVGRKGMDDGLVLFVFANDRKARIEVGYGLEGQMSDAIASRILYDGMIPRIKAGDRDGAVTAGVDQLIAALGGTGAAAEKASAPPQTLGLFQIIAIGLIGIVLILLAFRYPSLALYLFTFLFSRGGPDGSGGFGGRGGRSGGGGATGRW